MTNRDMVKGLAGGEIPRAREGLSGDEPRGDTARGRPATQPGPGADELQFPPTLDPLDSTQLKPMIDQKHGPGLKRPSGRDR